MLAEENDIQIHELFQYRRDILLNRLIYGAVVRLLQLYLCCAHSCSARPFHRHDPAAQQSLDYGRSEVANETRAAADVFPRYLIQLDAGSDQSSMRRDTIQRNLV